MAGSVSSNKPAVKGTLAPLMVSRIQRCRISPWLFLREIAMCRLSGKLENVGVWLKRGRLFKIGWGGLLPAGEGRFHASSSPFPLKKDNRPEPSVIKLTYGWFSKRLV